MQICLTIACDIDYEFEPMVAWKYVLRGCDAGY